MALKLFGKFTDYTLTVLRLTRVHPVNNIFGVLSDIGRYNDKANTTQSLYISVFNRQIT